jgi:hypothetical protein
MVPGDKDGGLKDDKSRSRVGEFIADFVVCNGASSADWPPASVKGATSRLVSLED